MDGPVTSRFRKTEGDWTCSDTHCANINFARRLKCNRCGKDKAEPTEGEKKKKLGHEIGKELAEKSHGLFSADDWQCNKCGNVNWARRQECNMCNAPKFGVVEERTGFGGGYNDRGVVEYRERDDSDGEYDEFGRRRKKRSQDGGNQDLSSDDRRKAGAGGDYQHGVDDEEEEEEEDEEDLSKYDLSEWGDADEEGDEQKEKDREGRRPLVYENNVRKSRSRSRSPARESYYN